MPDFPSSSISVFFLIPASFIEARDFCSEGESVILPSSTLQSALTASDLTFTETTVPASAGTVFRSSATSPSESLEHAAASSMRQHAANDRNLVILFSISIGS
jgi:hypothetical protein